MKEFDYDLMEKNIIEADPYDWKKHFLFQLPEMFWFVVKLGLICLTIYVFTYSLSSVLIEKLPTFCSIYQSNLQK